MSNKAQLQTNNTTLDALITRVNAAKDTAASLPDAGGSGGGSVETCTVRIICNTADIRGYTYTKIVDGTIQIENTGYNDTSKTLDITLNNVLCGSFIFVVTSIAQGMLSVTINGDALYEIGPSITSAASNIAIIVPTVAGSYSEVIIVDNN